MTTGTERKRAYRLKEKLKAEENPVSKPHKLPDYIEWMILQGATPAVLECIVEHNEIHPQDMANLIRNRGLSKVGISANKVIMACKRWGIIK
jgi:hypothetical protein